MELREFLQPFRKNWKLIVLTVLVLGVGAYVVSLRLPFKYRATVTLYMQAPKALERTEENYFTYDGYYAYKAAQEYTDTVLGFFESPDILYRAGELIWGETDTAQQKRLQKAVYAEKIAPQLVKLTVTLDNADEASQLAEALTQAIREKSAILSTAETSGVEISTLIENPIVETVKPMIWLNTVVASLAGMLASVVIVWLREYFLS